MSCSVCAGYSSYNCPCCGEEVRMMICPDCKGTGEAPYKAYHIHNKVTVVCSELTWQALPPDESSAYVRNENWCRWPRECCPTCKGDGEIPENS